MEIVEAGITQNSDDENAIKFVNTNRRNYRIVDSDSDTDVTKEQNNSTITSNKLINDNSDSSDNEQDFKSDEETTKNKPKRIAIIDSVSDDEDTETPNLHNPKPIISTNNENELIENSKICKSNLNNLCDPESSDDDFGGNNKNSKSNKSTKPRQRSSRKTKESNDTQPKKLKSGKEAVEQRKEIVAESQRMLRESRVSLPYHVPKMHSLKEFLEKRPRLASTVNLSENIPPPVAIKMTKDQLEIVSKKLDERSKEVEQFYKSDSESDTENADKEIERTQIEIRNWLDSLVDTAVDSIEARLNDEETSLDCELSCIEEKETDEQQEPKKLSKYAILMEKLANIQPKLSGNPDEIIDLDSGITRPSEIKKLVDKYIEHTFPKHLHKDKVETNVVSVSGGDIHQETVTVRVDDDEEVVPKFEIPGAKLKKLKEKLINEMAEKRSELWKQKNIAIINEKSNDNEDKDGYEDDYLDDEEEEELEFSATSSEEEIDEEGYEKSENKPKCSFLDDEADVDDNVDDDDDAAADDDDDAAAADDDDDDDHNGIEEHSDNTKKLKRVITGFNDDTDDDDDVDVTINDKPNLKHITQDDFVMPPNVAKINQSPHVEKSQSELDFLTPVTFITGLQNLNSEQKLQESPIISPFKLPTQPSPLRGDKWQSKLQKKLFEEPYQEKQQRQMQEEEVPTTQDLLEICSGEFPDSQQQPQQSVKEPINIVLNKNKEIKELDQDNDNVISQILIEDDLDEFEKRLNSNNDGIINEIKPTGIIDSDDENGQLDFKQQKKKKFIISDESSDDDDDDDVDNEKEIDLHDNTGLEQDEDINYDSEENEIVVNESHKFTVNDFVENEAELSESEWDSDDEDENNLDEMELEQGDKEEFDVNKIRTDIEKIHMRRLLDDDTREIKLLQELLLEDGELHGTGRQRQFRWRNIDSVDGEDNDQNKDDEDGVYLDEEENEEEWRKMRHKREMFLKQNSQNDNDNDDDVVSILESSKILKIGQKSIRTSQSFNNSQNKIKTTEETDEIIKQSFGLSMKRGSFLSRNDQVLQRLAEYTKVSTNIVATTKTSKSFVFQSKTILNQETKRKATTEETPKALKKIRLDNFSPATDRQKSTTSSKKLF